jgi:hypothetical protein
MNFFVKRAIEISAKKIAIIPLMELKERTVRSYERNKKRAST